MLFPLQQSITFMISLRWGDQTQFLSSIAKVSCGIWACHYIQTDGIWLIFSAIFKVFLCFGRLLLKCWKSCNFHAFPTAGKPHFYNFIALRGPNPVSFVHCQGFLRNLSMSLHTNRWHMAYFLCNFHFFLCFGRLLPNCWKSRSFHPLNGFLCHFLVLTLRWGAPSGTTAEKVAISMLFPLQESLTFMISLR